MRRIAVILLLVAACSRQSDGEKRAKTRESWAATINLATEELHAHKLPPRYVTQIAESAEEELKKEKTDDAATHAAIAAAQRLRAECEQR